jgi:hypothetical protein
MVCRMFGKIIDLRIVKALKEMARREPVELISLGLREAEPSEAERADLRKHIAMTRVIYSRSK